MDPPAGQVCDIPGVVSTSLSDIFRGVPPPENLKKNREKLSFYQFGSYSKHYSQPAHQLGEYFDPKHVACYCV